MALTDADRLQMTAMALMRHSVVGGGGAPAESLINYDAKYSPKDYCELLGSYKRYGPDTTGGHTYFAYSQYSGTYSADKAFDDDAATYWRSVGVTTSEYIGLDLGSGNSAVVKVLTINNGSYTSYSIKDFIFQGSNDGLSWDDLYFGTALKISTLQYFLIDNDVGYRYYRIKNNGDPYYPNRIIIPEIQMLEEV